MSPSFRRQVSVILTLLTRHTDDVIRFSRYLLGCYVVHSTFLMKVMQALWSPFLSQVLRQKLYYTPNLRELFKFFNPEQLKVTPEIYR